MPKKSAPPVRGRPVDVTIGRRVLRATLVEIAAHGVTGCKVDAIAARADVSKATIYKRWPSKDELCLEAIASIVVAFDVAETSDPRRDLIALLGDAVSFGNRAPFDRILPRIVGEMVDRKDLARAFRRSIVQPRRNACAALLGRAIDSGALRADLDLDLAVDQLIGPIMFRWLVSGAALPAAMPEALVDALWTAYASP